MIDDLTRERILDAANIVEVVSDFVSLRKRGVNYLGLCPFHSDRNPSFSVSPAKTSANASPVAKEAHLFISS